jgi:hypothetical protein
MNIMRVGHQMKLIDLNGSVSAGQTIGAHGSSGTYYLTITIIP